MRAGAFASFQPAVAKICEGLAHGTRNAQDGLNTLGRKKVHCSRPHATSYHDGYTLLCQITGKEIWFVSGIRQSAAANDGTLSYGSQSILLTSSEVLGYLMAISGHC